MKEILYVIIIILISIIVISIIYNNFYNKTILESFYNIDEVDNNPDMSVYSKGYILNDCINNYARIYKFDNPEEVCLNNAYVKNPNLLCGICGNNDYPLKKFETNDPDIPLLYGCPKNTINNLELTWNSRGLQNGVNVDNNTAYYLTCNKSSNTNIISNLYLYVWCDDDVDITLNDKSIRQRGWTTIGEYFFENVKSGDLLTLNGINTGGPGGIAMSYIWNKQLYIMNNNGFENCANVMYYSADSQYSWNSTTWNNSLFQMPPWMRNQISMSKSTITVKINVGEIVNTDTLSNDLSGFLGVDDLAKVYLNNKEVFNKTQPWNEVVNFNVKNVNENDDLRIDCVNTGGPGGITFTYIWGGSFYAMSSSKPGFNSCVNLIRYQPKNINGKTTIFISQPTNLRFVTDWLNAGSGRDFGISIKMMKKTVNWTFPDSLNNWTSLKQNNLVGTWSDLGIASNSNMSISFWINITSLSTSWRNIFHFTNTGNNCCNVGDRVPALWIYPNNGTNLHYRSSTTNVGNNGIDTDPLEMNRPVYITLVFNDNNVNIYINSVVNKKITYSDKITPTDPNCKFYIADPWHPCDGFKIKDFILYDKVLSEDEVKDIYSKGSGPYIKNTPIGCGINKFCVAVEDNKAYCYGSTQGCLWGSNDCTNDSQCSKYNKTTTPKYTDQGVTCDNFKSGDGWPVDTCSK